MSLFAAAMWPAYAVDLATPGTGTGLDATYYANYPHNVGDLSGFAVLERVDASVNFAWGTSSPGTNVPAYQYSVVWNGQLEPRVTGTHTIHLTSCGGRRVWINGKAVIDNWNSNTGEYTGTVDLVAGQKVPIRVDYFEDTGKSSVKLEWEAGGLSREVIPTSQLYPESLPTGWIGIGSGLAAGYFPGLAFTGTPVLQTDADINFSWPTSPFNGFPADYFSVRWQGRVTPKLDEPTTLILTTDDGARMWIDGTMVVNDWTLHGAKEYRVALPQGAGNAHDIRIDYFENNGQAVAKLEWEGQHTPRQKVPMSQLSPAGSILTPAPSNGAGLSAAYFGNEACTGPAIVRRRDRSINFNWGFSSPAAPVPVDHFGVQWTGYLQTRFDEDYTLIAKMDDVVRIWIDDVQIMNVDDWKNEHRYTFTAKAGQKYRLRVEAADHSGAASAKLEWESPSEGRQTIPEACFYPDDLNVDVPASSTVSPAFVEGIHGAGLAVNAGSLAVVSLGDAGFALNVPLSADAPSPVSVSAGGGAASGSIAWTATSLTSNSSVVIRPGDALLFTSPVAGHWEISQGCGMLKESSAIEAGAKVPVTFSQPGDYVASIFDDNGTELGHVEIAVPGVAEQPATIPDQVGYARLKNVALADAADRSVITWTSSDPWLSVSTTTVSTDPAASQSLTIAPSDNRASTLCARINGANGPVLTSWNVRPFILKSDAEEFIGFGGMTADGAMLCPTALRMEPLVPGVSVHIYTIASGVTFEDSSTSRWVSSSSDFPLSPNGTQGVYQFTLIRSPGIKTGVCHLWKAFDNSTQVSP